MRPLEWLLKKVAWLEKQIRYTYEQSWQLCAYIDMHMISVIIIVNIIFLIN